MLNVDFSLRPSTVQELIDAMGGTLQITAEFPDRPPCASRSSAPWTIHGQGSDRVDKLPVAPTERFWVGLSASTAGCHAWRFAQRGYAALAWAINETEL